MTKWNWELGVDINRNALGFHKPGMWDKIVDVNECHLQASR